MPKQKPHCVKLVASPRYWPVYKMLDQHGGPAFTLGLPGRTNFDWIDYSYKELKRKAKIEYVPSTTMRGNLE